MADSAAKAGDTTGQWAGAARFLAVQPMRAIAALAIAGVILARMRVHDPAAGEEAA